jgi:DNA replicative helicase MCM subunit Mcm2 (Cdc46/Mcm family)
MVDASGASGKSLIGIVDKENDSLMVKYGVVVAAKNSHVVLNEASSLSHDDQWHLIGIAEEGKTSLDKWGEHIPIDAPTTLILTANPVGTKWQSPKMSKDKMIVIRQNLLDRMDQIYGFFDYQTQEEMEEFIEELDKITNRKPHNYNFLSKFLQYAKTIEPKLTETTRYRLNRFWIKAKLNDMAGNRSFFSIQRIAEAQAKLNLSWEVDDIIARKTMQTLQLMYNQYGVTVEQIQNPRDLTVEVFYNILKEKNGGIEYTVRELCKKGSEKNKQVDGYLKNRWDFETNRELKTIVNMLEQRENIKIVGLKPRILVYISDISCVSDLSDKSSSSDKNKDSFLPVRSDTQDRKEDQ